MIARMKKVSLMGARTDLKKVIDTLKATGSFQITFYKSTGTDLDAADLATKNQLTTRLSTVGGLLNYLKADHKTLTMTYADLQKVVKKQAKLDKIINRLEQAKIRTTELQSTKNHNLDTIVTLTPFAALPITADLLHHTRRTFVLAGLLSARDLTRFQNDLNTTDFIIETYPAAHGNVIVVMTGDLENLPIAETILDYDFTPFPANQTFPRTPQAQIDYLTAQNAALDAQIAAVTKQAQITNADLNLLKTYYDYLLNELDTLAILSATIQTKTCFVVHGWLPEKLQDKFTALIQATSKNIVIELKDATATDNPPAAVHNTRVVAPYNSITAMYGAPGRTDLDPNPFVAFFYFLFFGMMFGDVAYGLLLSLITGAILIFKKPQGGTRQMMALFLMGGLSAALWGLLFNSFFGLNLPSFLMPRTLMNPIENDATLFFALSLYLGVIQIMVGTLLNVINLLRQKQFTAALLKGLPHFVLFLGLTLSFPTLISTLITLNYPFMAWFKPLMLPGVIIMLVGFAGIVLFNGLGRKFGGYLIGMFSGAYKIVNYFSDILSYARLFGVGLVGCVIAYVANYLFGMFASLGFIGIILGAVVAVIFHAINIGLGLLSTYIHNARLQFVEFFGKFYEGSGTAFTPLGSKLRYTRILGSACI